MQDFLQQLLDSAIPLDELENDAGGVPASVNTGDFAEDGQENPSSIDILGNFDFDEWAKNFWEDTQDWAIGADISSWAESIRNAMYEPQQAVQSKPSLRPRTQSLPLVLDKNNAP
jgi:hypothetical protein